MPLLKNIFKVMFLSFNSLKLQLMEKKKQYPKKARKSRLVTNIYIHAECVHIHTFFRYLLFFQFIM